MSIKIKNMYNLQLLKNKPQKVVWTFIIVVAAIMITKRVLILDVQMYNAYFGFGPIQTGILISAFLGLIGLIYWLMRNKKLVDWMTIIHVIVTLFIFLGLMIFYISTGNNTDHHRIINQIFPIVISILGLTQILFLINIFLSLGRDISKPQS